MFGLEALKATLTGTTALIGAALLATPPAARAASFTVSAVSNATQALGAGDSLTVTNTGTISGVNPAVTAVNVVALSVNNSGTVSGTKTSIIVKTTANISGGITNAGIIHGSSRGIFVQSHSDISGGITNNGTISGGGAGRMLGIVVGTHSDISGGITNTGSIVGGQAGILVTSSNISGGITNQVGGVISGSSGYGVAVGSGSSISGKITNAGTISGGIAGIGVGSASEIAGGITNSGTIHGGSAAGIAVRSYSDISGGITNSGTISGGQAGIGVGSNSNISGGIVNQASGVISGSQAGIGVGYGSDVSGGITNSGTIHGGKSGIGVSNADISGGITNEAGGIISGGSDGIYVGGNGTIFTGVIDNSGTISGTSVGIFVETHSNISGGIHNLAGGIISGGHSGILVRYTSNISGGIANAGTIIGASSGIFVQNNSDISGGITNRGTISGGRYGIAVTSSNISGGITNEADGVISGGGVGVGIGGQSNMTGDIINSGRISGSLSGIGVGTSSNVSGHIVNQAGGVIFGSTLAGIGVRGHSDISGGITNSGTVSGTGVGIGAITNSDISGGIVNQAGGVVTGHTGVLVSASKISGGITNAGTIDGTGGTAISLAGLTGSTPIVIDGGHIIGDVIDDNPANGFSPVTVGGDFTSQGNFDVSSFSVSSGATFTSHSAVSDDGAIMVSAAGSSITGGLDVNAGGALTVGGDFAVNGALTNAGAVTINNGKTLTTTTFTGSGGSAMDIQIGRSGGVLTAGELVVTGGGVDLSNAALNIAIVTGSQLLADGSTAVIANGTAPATAPVAAIADSSFIYDYTVTPTAGNNLTLTVAMNLPAATTGSSNLNTAQTLLVSLAESTDPQINAIQSKLIQDTNAASFNHDVEAAAPTVDGSGQVAALDVSNNTLGLVGERLASLRDGADSVLTGMAAGDAYRSGKDNDSASLLGQAKPVSQPAAPQNNSPVDSAQNQTSAPTSTVSTGGIPATMMWAEAFGQNANQGERDNVAGYNANTWGGAAGMDTRNIADNLIAGIAGSYGRTDASSDNANTTDTAVDSYQLTLYGTYQPTLDTYIDGMAAYGWNKNDTTRHNVGGVSGLTAHGSYNANQVTAQIEAGHDYKVDDTILTPNVLAHTVWYDPGSYTETGAGGAGLHVDGNSQSLFDLGAGLKAGWVLRQENGGVLKPQLRAGYRYALADDRIEDTSAFTGGGATFTTQGPDPARSAVNLGASLKYATPENWEFTASYDFDWKADYTSNAGFVRAGYRF